MCLLFIVILRPQMADKNRAFNAQYCHEQMLQDVGSFWAGMILIYANNGWTSFNYMQLLCTYFFDLFYLKIDIQRFVLVLTKRVFLIIYPCKFCNFHAIYDQIFKTKIYDSVEPLETASRSSHLHPRS